MTTQIAVAQTYLELVRESFATHGDRPAFAFLPEGEIDGEQTTSYSEFELAARTVAADLQAAGVRRGDRVMVLEAPGQHMVMAFMGCLYAGTIAVPAYPPNPFMGARGNERLQAMVMDAGASAVVTLSFLRPVLDFLDEAFPTLSWVYTDTPATAPDAYSAVDVGPDDVAFLQYTSGSTGSPRGVRVTHGSLAAQIRMIYEGYELAGAPVSCSWLPPFHDMGLIGLTLTPLAVGAFTVHMSPDAFLRRPERWLRAMTHYRGTTTSSPNFGYELCVRRVNDLEGIDLSAWSVAISGAEPIRERTLAEFERKFAQCGFRPSTFWPSYGLAEATLMVTCGSRRPDSTVWFDADELSDGRLVARDAPAGRPLVSCGRPPSGTTVTICDPEGGEPLPEGQIGEIRVSGPHVCDGYWQNPELSAELFPDGILRTGDLGALWQGELFVTGRIKDLLIVRGRNHYPQDIEQTMETADPNLRRGCGVAVSVATDSGEQLVLIQEIKRDSTGDPQQIIEKIRRQVVEQHGITPDAIALVGPASVPKTTSGKLRRSTTGEAYRNGTLNLVHQWTATNN